MLTYLVYRFLDLFHLQLQMESLTYHREWELVLLGPDSKKIDQLGSFIESTVYHFSGVPPFMDFLRTTIDAQARLIFTNTASSNKRFAT